MSKKCGASNPYLQMSKKCGAVSGHGASNHLDEQMIRVDLVNDRIDKINACEAKVVSMIDHQFNRIKDVIRKRHNQLLVQAKRGAAKQRDTLNECQQRSNFNVDATTHTPITKRHATVSTRIMKLSNGFDLAVHFKSDLVTRLGTFLGVIGKVSTYGMPSGLLRLPATLIRKILLMASPDPTASHGVDLDKLRGITSMSNHEIRETLRQRKWSYRLSGTRTELVSRLQRVVAAEHWPQYIVVTGAGTEVLNGEYKMTFREDIRNEYLRGQYSQIGDIIWRKDSSDVLSYIRHDVNGLWYISRYTPRDRARDRPRSTDIEDYYVSSGPTPAYKHPFELDWRTVHNGKKPAPTIQKYEIPAQLQRMIAGHHWPQCVAVTGADPEHLNGEYVMTSGRRVRDITWRQRDTRGYLLPPYIHRERLYLGRKNGRDPKYRWYISGDEFKQHHRYCEIGPHHYESSSTTGVYEHPCGLEWRTLSDGNNTVTVRACSPTNVDRRGWGLVLELVMRRLSHKFGLVEVADGLQLSVPDATAFTWCMMHFAARIELAQTDDEQDVDVDHQSNAVARVVARWRRSGAKTWVAFMSGGQF